MKDRDFHGSLERACKAYQDLGLLYKIQSQRSLPVNKNFNSLALDTTVPYPEIYFCGLREEQYNFILKDRSYFQFSYNSEEDLRYAFYPSPYGPPELNKILMLEDAWTNEMLDDEAYFGFMQAVPLNYRRPVIRYEFNTYQYVKGVHPASHLHIGTFGEDRWSILHVLTPHAFALFLGKLYFNNDWEAVTELDKDENRIGNPFDELLFSEKSSCASTLDGFFSSHEKRCFYFG